MTYEAYRATRRFTCGGLSSWGKRTGAPRLAVSSDNQTQPRFGQTQRQSQTQTRVPALHLAVTSGTAAIVLRANMAASDNGITQGKRRRKPEVGRAQQQHHVTAARFRMKGVATKSANRNRVSADPLSQVPNNRCTRPRVWPGPPPPVPGSAKFPAPVRPLGKVRISRRVPTDDLGSFALPTLPEVAGGDAAPRLRSETAVAAVPRSARRRSEVSSATTGDSGESCGRGGGIHVAPPSGLLGAGLGSGGGGDLPPGHGGGAPVPGEGGRADTGQQGRRPNENTTTTTNTMFINRNQCVFIERTPAPGYTGGGPGTGGARARSRSRARAQGGGVGGGGGHGHHRDDHDDNPAGTHWDRGGGWEEAAQMPVEAGKPSRGGKQWEDHLRFNTASGNQSLPPPGAKPAANMAGTSPEPSGASSSKMAREHNFVKKLYLLNQRQKAAAAAAAATTSCSSSTSTSITSSSSSFSGLDPARRNVNLPMHIKVQLPTNSGARQSQETLLLRRTQKQIRDIMREGASCPESNCSTYASTLDPSVAVVTNGAKLTTMFFPSAASPEVDYFDEWQQVFDHDAMRTCRLPEEPGTMMQKYAVVGLKNPTAVRLPAPQSAGYISTRRLPSTSRVQSAHVCNGTGATLLQTGSVQSPGSGCGGQLSRPTSSRSADRLQQRSWNSSIADNLLISASDIPNKASEMRAMWPSLIDVQRLKIGGFRYKNKHKNLGCDEQSHQHPTEGGVSDAVNDAEDGIPKEESSETRKKTILSLGTIIVPSHTCIDCPLCSLYYTKEAVLPDGPPSPPVEAPAASANQRSHGGLVVKNTNNSDSGNVTHNRLSAARRAKSARAYIFVNKERLKKNSTVDEVDITKLNSQMPGVPSAPRSSPEPEPEICSSHQSHSTTDADTGAEADVALAGDGGKTLEVSRLMVGVSKRSLSNAPASLTTQRPRTAAPPVVECSRKRNPFSNFREEGGVSVTVRMPGGAAAAAASKFKATYGQVMNNPVNLKFSYVQGKPSNRVEADCKRPQ